MSLQELQHEVRQLSAEDRAKLRAQLDALDTLSDAAVLEEWTNANRAAEMGAVVTRDEAVARLREAGKAIE